MRVSPFVISCSMAFLWLLSPYPAALNNGVSDGNQTAVRPQNPASRNPVTRRPVGSVTSGAHDRNRELLEKESVLNLKEQELKKISANLDARMKELEDARKSIETALSAKKKVDDERYKKILKLYKTLRPEEAAKLLDKLDEDIALEMLNRMDTKAAAKLVPYLDQKRVLKWTRASLKDN